jgi:acetyl esterase/lipase
LYGRAVLTGQSIQPADLRKQSVADADRKLAYGKGELQFGELRLPKTKGPYPVVILVHGGCYVDRLPPENELLSASFAYLPVLLQDSRGP